MKVLMITGDKNFAASPRFALQASQVERLAVVYWGRGSLWPKILQGHFDVVTVQDPLLRGAFACHVANKIEAGLNVQVHMDLQALPWWKRMLAKMILRRADSVRVVSEKIKKQVEAIGVRAKISVLPVYVDVERFKNIVPVPHGQKTVLWLGRFEPEKDPLYALEVFKKVWQNIDTKMVMLGQGSLEKVLRAKIGKLNLPVIFPGWQDPATYLAQADVVLSTSLHESWGASIVEALAAGVPVVAPDVGVAQEAGATVTPRDELAGAVIKALRTGTRGRLQLSLLSQELWAQEWVKTL
jgi:glycosyltransferase involved in cell wall biosynthesis